MINTRLVYAAFFVLSSVYGQPITGQNKITIPCEEGWYFFGEKCYKIGNYDRVTYEEAITHCAEVGAKLASIHSKEQNDFLTAFLALNMKQFPWIGLDDRANEGIYVWQDGSSYDYKNWNHAQPDNNWFGQEKEDCAELVLELAYPAIGKWNDLPCHHKKGYICQKESKKEQKSPDPQFCSDGDGRGWKFRDSCFTLVSERKSWEDAEKYCQDRFNSHLMMVIDEDHDYFLKFVLRNTKSRLWIGLKTQDTFQQMWTTGWPVSYNHFDNPLEEMETGSCTLRWNADIWTDAPCHEKYEFVCQKVDSPAIKKPTDMSKCPEVPNDWRDFGGEYCYFFDKELSVTWVKAQEICHARGGVLATIHSQEEEKVLNSFLRPLARYVSIGLNSLLTGGEKYTWSDGSKLSYTNWGPSEPNTKHEMCTEIRIMSMDWNDITCDVNVINFLCQVKKVHGQPNTGLNRITIPCERGWYFFGEKCYKIGMNDRVNYEEAIEHCASMRAKLASVHSKEQNDFLTAFLALNKQQFPWIGLDDRAKEGTYVWQDGSSYDYQNWHHGQPDNNWFGKEKEDCAELVFELAYPSIGKWNDLPCHHKKGYICQKDSNREQKSPDPQFCSDGDGGGWKFRDSCFNLVNEKKSWGDAEKYCQDRFNSHLMMVIDEYHDYFLEFVLRKTKSPLWIGLKTQASFQQMWATGWPVSYNHFNNPLEEMDTGSCILRWNSNIWTNAPCHEKYKFVCQKVDPPAIKKPTRMSKCPAVPNDWRDFGGEYCYFFDKDQSVTWFKAQEICHARGGVLATIHSQEEEKLLHSFLRPLARYVSIGLNSLLTGGEIYSWSDRSELKYTHWGPSEPNGKHEMCVEFRIISMDWNDITCDVNVINFLCQVKKEVVTSDDRNVGSAAPARPSKYCLNPGNVENGRVTYLPGINGRINPQANPADPEYPEGARLQYVCNSGYRLMGLSILKCEKSGEWSSKRPTCTSEEDLYCDKPRPFPNGRITYYPPGSASSADIRNIQEFPEDSRLEYSCAEGYRIEGSSSRECASNGMWRSSAPICEIDCGKSSKRSVPKITNGNKTEVGEWPWIVGIAVKEGNVNRIICGGALITSKAILTAAHCLTDRNSLILYFGKYHRYDKNDDTEVERRQSENIIIHQDYNRDTMNSDIGLVTFSRPIRFTKRIKPICLPTNAWKTAENLEPTKSGYVTGWGLTERKLPSDELLLAHLPVVTNEACINGYERNGMDISITTNMYCAGFAEGGQNVCKGDSGSPMVFYDEYKEKYTIEGLVSFSLRGQCGQPERYSIFTKVFQFVPWILSKTKIN